MRARKSTLLFFNAALIHTLSTEIVGAWAAARAGMPNTLYHFFVLYDVDVPTPAPRRVVLALLSPIVVSAALCLGAAWVRSRARSAAVRLFALYLATFAAIGVLAPLTFGAWSGRLHDIVVWLELPDAISVALSLASGLFLGVVMWEAGRRAQPVLSALALPLLAGTLLRLLVLVPVPVNIVINVFGGSTPWLVAVAGALWQRRATGGPVPATLPPINLAWSAMSLSLLLVTLVRWLATGIRFGP